MIEIEAEGIDYIVFGRLRSQLEFPDLSRAPERRPPDREIQVRELDPPAPIELLGSREIGSGWVFHLHRVEDGMCLAYGDTGSYGIHSEGRTLVWYPDPGTAVDPAVQLEMVRAILLGPVMALALHERGIACLHGSAVTIGGEAVVFLAPKHHGKSTLALSLTAAGARLVSDDLVAIDMTGSPTVLPGVHSVRLWSDVAERLGERLPGSSLREGVKQTLTDLPRRSLSWARAPLAAVYVVRPVRALRGGGVVQREILPPARAVSELALGKKLHDTLIGMSRAGAMLRGMASLAAEVPVYRLRIVRDLDRLDDVVEEILAWHGAGAGAAGEDA